MNNPLLVLDNKKKSFFADPSNRRYSNLTLNQGRQFPSFFPVQNNDVIKNSRMISSYDYLQSTKKDLNAWKKDDRNLQWNNSRIFRDDLKKQYDAGNELRRSLAFDIIAYENSLEDFASDTFHGVKNDGLKKKTFGAQIGIADFVIQNPFEFPRQTENDENKEPEVSQFKASQKLLNPNESNKTKMANSVAESLTDSMDEKINAIGIFLSEEKLEELKANYLEVDRPTTEKVEPAIGDNVYGFTIIAKIGKGGNGSVFVGKKGDRYYAFKCSKYGGTIVNEYETLQAFFGKKRLIQSCTRGKAYPNDYYYLVMKLVGINLFSTLKCRPDGQIATMEMVCTYMMQSLKALEELHDMEYIHQDIKLQNFAVGIDEPYRVYLIDFGAVEKLGADGTTIGCIGTPSFASRDALAGNPQCKKSDMESWLYSLIYGMSNITFGYSTNEEMLNEREEFWKEKKRLDKLPAPIQKIMEIIDGIKPLAMVNYEQIQIQLKKIINKQYPINSDELETNLVPHGNSEDYYFYLNYEEKISIKKGALRFFKKDLVNYEQGKTWSFICGKCRKFKIYIYQKYYIIAKPGEIALIANTDTDVHSC